MSNGQFATLLAMVLGAGVFGAAYGWFSAKSRKLKEDEFNRNLRMQLVNAEIEAQSRLRNHEKALEEREAFVAGLRAQLDAGILPGRRWLARFVAEAEHARDEAIAHKLQTKKHPAAKAAEEVAAARAERRQYKERAKFLEYQLLSLKEYFPFLEEYEEVILEESVPLGHSASNLDALEEADPVLRFLSKQDYERLPSAERNQLALTRYLGRSLSAGAVGRLYERYLGYRYEAAGWHVEYHGIVKGYEDLGRDLICMRGDEIHIVQAKCWSAEKVIHEKHVFQLFGTTQLYLMGRSSSDLFPQSVTARLVTTTSLSSVARKAAERLKIEVEERLPLDKSFPMIKCNVNHATGEKIYHLPFDQQYDRTKISPARGERYVSTAQEAERLGFRRAFKYTGRSE